MAEESNAAKIVVVGPAERATSVQLTFRFLIPFGNKQRVDASLFSPEDYSSRGERITTIEYKFLKFFNLKGEIL